jgi:hypothetical protein
MSFNLAKKNRPQLTDYNFLQKIVENKKVEEKIVEQSLFGKIYEKIQSNFYKFIEDNIFYTFIFVCIICFLIYRYLQYQTRKSNDNTYDSIVMDEHFQLSIKRASDDITDDDNNKILQKDLKKILKKKLKRRLKKHNKNRENKNDDIYTIQEGTEKSESNKENTCVGHMLVNHQDIPENIMYDEQHIKQIPELLKVTKDRDLNTININHTLINSSSYAPYNLQNLNTELYPWKANEYEI